MREPCDEQPPRLAAAFAGLARRALTLEADELIEQVLETSLEIVGADIAVYVSVEENGRLVVRHTVGVPQSQVRGVEAEAGTALDHATTEDEALVVEEFAASPFEPTDFEVEHDLSSGVVAPVPGPSRVFGALGEYSREASQFAVDQLEFIECAAGLLGEALERESAHRRREKTQRRMSELVHRREEMLANLSHDLRSPANALKLQLALVRRYYDQNPELQDEIHRSLEAAERSLDRMVDLTAEILDGARETVADELEIEPVNFSRQLRELLDEFREPVDEAESSLSVDIEAGLHGRSDRLRFEQIARNLLSNAVKYGDGQPIEVSLRGDDSEVRLVVRDRGIGIAPENHDLVFGRFHRTDPDDQRNSYGLGLWIAQKGVDLLGGQIDLESTPGQGSTFTVTLPRRERLNSK